MFESFFKFEIFYLPVWFWSFMFIVFGMMIWLIVDKNKRVDKFRKENDPKNAKAMYHHSVTPPFGTEAFVVSPNKWIIVQWDKNKNILNIWIPSYTYKTPKEYRIGEGVLNWKFSEIPKVYTTVEQHFKRQVM